LHFIRLHWVANGNLYSHNYSNKFIVRCFCGCFAAILFFGEPEIISKLANFYRAGGVIDKAETGGLFLEFCKAVMERLSESKKIPKDTIECLILGANTR